MCYWRKNSDLITYKCYLVWRTWTVKETEKGHGTTFMKKSQQFVFSSEEAEIVQVKQWDWSCLRWSCVLVSISSPGLDPVGALRPKILKQQLVFLKQMIFQWESCSQVNCRAGRRRWRWPWLPSIAETWRPRPPPHRWSRDAPMSTSHRLCLQESWAVGEVKECDLFLSANTVCFRENELKI